MGAGVEARQAHQRSTRVRPPVRREQPREGWDEVDAGAVGHLPGQFLALCRAGDDAEVVSQPLHRRAGDRDRAFQRVHRILVTEPVTDRGEQAVAGPHRPCPGVQQQKVACAIGVLGLPGGEAHLTDGRRVLVAESTGQRHLAAQRPGPGGRPVTGRLG